MNSARRQDSPTASSRAAQTASRPRSTAGRRASVALCGAALLAVAGCGHEAAPNASTSAAQAQQPTKRPRTVVAAERQLPRTLQLDGTLLADEESRVTPIVAGRVTAVLVERGSKVEAGDPLVRLRDVDFKLQERAARAQLDQARARLGLDDNGNVPSLEETADVRSAAADLALANQTLTRIEELGQRGVVSAQQLDEARTRAEAARERHRNALSNARAAFALLSSAEVGVRQAHENISESVVRAPFAGEVAERLVSIGEHVTPQSPVVTLVSVQPLRVELQVPQQFLADVHVGQPVTLKVDAFPGRTFQGSVRYISAAVRRETRGLTVEAIIDNADGTLRPGMFGQVRVDLGHTDRVAVVPTSAVLTEAGVNRAFVIQGDRIEERVVAVSERSEREAVITDGLRPGEVVATERLDALVDGQRVR